MKTITINSAMAVCKLLEETNNGRIFFVEFTKKDGSVRRMTARKRVTKGVKGVGLAYKPLGKGLMNAFDMDKQEFRMIDLTKVRKFSVNNHKYEVI